MERPIKITRVIAVMANTFVDQEGGSQAPTRYRTNGRFKTATYPIDHTYYTPYHKQNPN